MIYATVTSISPSGGHVSREVSSIMEQLIVLEQLLCRVVRLHALRTDEALNTETHHYINHVTLTHQSFRASSLQLCLQVIKVQVVNL